MEAIEERLARAKEIVELFERANQILPRVYETELQTAKVEWQKIEKDNNLIVGYIFGR